MAAQTKKSLSTPRRRPRVEHGTSVLTAFRRIRDLIIKGRLSPGSWLLESDICAHLNMSRTPVRGAFHQLQREGYVVEHRNGSKSRRSVAPLTLADARELYSIIGRIEGLAARRAAELPAARRHKLAVQLDRVNRRLRELSRKGLPAGPAAFDLDHEFHRLLVTAGAGPRLQSLHDAIEPQTERYWRLYSGAVAGTERLSFAEHETIVARLRAGDGARLDAAIQTNWKNGLDRLAAIMQVFGERGAFSPASEKGRRSKSQSRPRSRPSGASRKEKEQ